MSLSICSIYGYTILFQRPVLPFTLLELMDKLRIAYTL